jgi:excisionase family DNA binding protein
MAKPSKKRVESDALVLPPPIQGRPRPLTKSELCEWLHCSAKYIEAEVAKGNLKSHKMSNRMVRFTWPAIDAWLERKAV